MKLIRAITTKQLTQELTSHLTHNKDLVTLSQNKAFKDLLGFLLANSATNTAIAFSKDKSEAERLRAIDKVAFVDEILNYILNYKEQTND